MTKRYYQKYNCRSICILHKKYVNVKQLSCTFVLKVKQTLSNCKSMTWKKILLWHVLRLLLKKISSRTHPYHQKYLGRVLTLLKAFQLAQGVKYFYYCRIYQISASVQILSTYFWKKV